MFPVETEIAPTVLLSYGQNRGLGVLKYQQLCTFLWTKWAKTGKKLRLGDPIPSKYEFPLLIVMMEEAMSICELLSAMPWWYYAALILFSLYYAVRGVVSEVVKYREAPFSRAQKVIIFYIQEFVFKIIFTASSFLSLAIAYKIFSSLKSLGDISAGAAVLLVFLFVWGILGLSGYLTGLILAGKFPGVK